MQKILPILGRISTISEAKVYELSKVSFIEKLSRLTKENWSKVIQLFESSSTLTIGNLLLLTCTFRPEEMDN